MRAILGPWMAVVVAVTLLLIGAPASQAASGGSILEGRIDQWPHWTLPAPLRGPGRRDLSYPSWVEGFWLASGDGGERMALRFWRNDRGQVVGDRAFNARAIGQAVLGDQLLRVQNDPQNPNRQLAVLQGNLELESSVVARRSEQHDPQSFLADELVLQVLHGPGEPRVSRVETISRFQLSDPDHIEVQQWQASYGSPAQGLAASAERSWNGHLRLERIRNDPAGP